jgi:predicted phosphodiesterase
MIGCRSGFICERNECIDESMLPTMLFVLSCDHFPSALKDKIVRFDTKKTNREVCQCGDAVVQSDKVVLSAA